MLLEYIDRSRVVNKLLDIQNLCQLAQENIAEVEDQARLTGANTVRRTKGDLTSMALIGEIKDRLLVEKVLAENIDLKNTVMLTIQRDPNKTNASAMTVRAENGESRKQGGSNKGSLT